MRRAALSTRLLLLLLFPLLSAAGEGIEVEVVHEEGALIVRSPISQGNFLFRAPGEFRRADETPEGFLLRIEAQREGATARMLLRIDALGAPDLRLPLAALAEARGHFSDGLEDPGKPVVEGEGERLLVSVRGSAGGRDVARTTLLVRDGTRLYLLRQEEQPPGGPFAEALKKTAAGFTILDPKGAAAPTAPQAADLEPRVIEHDYYRLRVYKPAGFAEQEVDPDADEGIFLHLRREDAQKNLCEIRIRVHLAKTVKRTLEEMAAQRMQVFEGRYVDARVPKRAQRTRWPAAKAALKCRLVGRAAKGGLVITEEWRFIEHENDRFYEIQMTLWGGAEREWKKDLRAFWSKLKIINK